MSDSASIHATAIVSILFSPSDIALTTATSSAQTVAGYDAFSIFKSFPSPFYILDEVEAALDDANLHRMINLLDKIKEDAQYIIVTHQQQTMHAGDVLYGVTMEPGSGSRVFTKTKEDFESLIGTNEK